MSNVRLHDVISSIEDWLLDNWPNPYVRFYPSSADAPRPFDGTDASTWVTAQWISFDPVPQRPSEDWNEFDLRLICQASSNDRLKAAEVADALRDLIRSAVVQVVDRADGATARGWVRFNEVGITPPQPDERDVVVAVVDVTGWAHAS